MSLLLSKLLQLSPSIQLGLVYVSCLPGGGFAYLVASVFNTHSTYVSATYNFVCTFATLGMLQFSLLRFCFLFRSDIFFTGIYIVSSKRNLKHAHAVMQ